MFQYPDTAWNHGEGFRSGAVPDTDKGGWHMLDDGRQVELADIQTTATWHNYTWATPALYPWADAGTASIQLHPDSPQTMRRFVGFLRPPAAMPLPTTGHPFYGAVTVPFVDNAAFEVFAPPAGLWNGVDPILVTIGSFGTLLFPGRHSVSGNPPADTWTSYGYRTTYPGVFSPDGLLRLEAVGGASGFSANILAATVGRPTSAEIVGSWMANPQPYYPIAAYIVPPVAGRQTELTMQRNLQLVQAIKLMLQSPALTPLPAALSAADVEDKTVFVFLGGSNGGFQSMLGALLHPDLVHGAYSTVFGATTGTDWILPLMSSAAATLPALRAGQTLDPAARRMSWVSGPRADHNWRQVTNPYNNQPILVGLERYLFADAIASKQSQAVPPALPPLTRPPAESLRGIDDPHEWHFGRLAVAAAPYPNAKLAYDPFFFGTVQPGAAGTWLGHMESLMIASEKVYVGGTEGVVSRFHVDWTPGGRQPLVRDAQSAQLGHEAWGLLALPGGDIIVGTRRHLHRLHADLTPVSVIELPMEEAKPYRLHLAEVDLGHPGMEVVYASAYGGLVAYDQALGPNSWRGEYSEPGVRDFIVSGSSNGRSVLTLLSERGVIGNLALDLNPTPPSPRAELTAATPPQNGTPLDLELAIICVPGWFTSLGTVALYSGDEQNLSLRAFDPSTLQPIFTFPNITGPMGGSGRRLELATAHWTNGQDVGDHLIVLNNDTLTVLAPGATGLTPVGMKSLFRVPPGSGNRLGSYTPGLHACAMAVGELGGGPSEPYGEEVVVATETGHLMWVHVDDLVLPGTEMPALYQMYDYTSAGGSNVQPRTNQALSCAWGLADHPNDAQHVHLFDQDGNHWRVGHGGVLELMNTWAPLAGQPGQVRGARYLGVNGVSQFIQNQELFWGSVGPKGALVARAWCPKNTGAVILEKCSLAGIHYFPTNWAQRAIPLYSFEGFGLFTHAGDVLTAGTGADCFWWADPPTEDINRNPVGWWGNMVLGVELVGSPATGTVANGLWASTDNATQGGGKHDYRDLRNITTGIPSLDQQSLRVVRHPTSGQIYVILGCPGGSVRILQPGSYDRGSGDHVLGQDLVLSEDYGHGGSALAVEPLANGTGVDIYFGVVVGNARSWNYPTQPLADSEVMTGRIVKLRWLYGATTLQQLWFADLAPSGGDPRGGYGVVGLYVDELFPNAPDPEEKEVVATTLAGDVLVFSESGALRFRASVPGAAGFYNSILARDLNQDGQKELYIAGSMGLHRFVTNLETQIFQP